MPVSSAAAVRADTAFAPDILDRLEVLAALTDTPGELTRAYLGAAHRAAATRVAEWMAEAGMAAHVDALGTVVGRYEGATPNAPPLFLGSHIDTVRNAGRYDGMLGVVSAIAVVERLHKSGRRLPFAIEVFAFGDEEGSRFPSTLSGSRALAGTLDPGALRERDSKGVTRADALRAFGCDPDQVQNARMRTDALAYVELHIEQGPVLEAADLPVGVVTAINGSSRGAITVTGVAGHAGTVPMDLRHDALMGAADVMLALEARARTEPDLVATVGKLKLPTGAVNTIPGNVEFTFDVRSPFDAKRQAAVADIAAALAAITARRNLEGRLEQSFEAPAAPCDAALSAALWKAVVRCGIVPKMLPSGAGHDAMAFRGVLPIAMLFVRCRGGISHNPAEFATAADIEVATRVLADFVETFQPASLSPK